MKNIFLMVLVINSILLSQDKLTVEDAIAIGLKNNFSIQIARNNSLVAQNNTGKGTAGFLPTLDASGNYSLSESKSETNSPFSFGDSDTKGYGANLSLNWTLFDGFKMFADNSRYLQLAKLGEYQAKNLIENTVVQILQAYFNLVQQEQLLDVNKRNLEVSRLRYEKEKLRNDLGASSKTDLLNSQVAYNNDQSNLIQQDLRVDIAKKNLNILLGKNPADDIKLTDEINIPEFPLDINQVEDYVFENNSRLTVARQNKLVAEQNVTLNRSNYFPRISLGANYNYSDRSVNSDSPNFTDAITTKSTDASVALNLSFNLFNGFRDNINLENAKVDALNQQLALKDEENDLRGLVGEKFSTFKTRIITITLEELNVAAAQQNLQLQQEKFETGTANSLEFRDAQTNLLRTEINLITSRYQTRIAILELQQLMGAISID